MIFAFVKAQGINKIYAPGKVMIMHYALCIVHLAFKSLAARRGASLPTKARRKSGNRRTLCFCFGLAGWLPSGDARSAKGNALCAKSEELRVKGEE